MHTPLVAQSQVGFLRVMHPSHFFKYYPAPVAKLVLSTKTVRWNSPLNFNDPFDCYFSEEPKFDWAQMTTKHLERTLDILLQQHEPQFDATNPYVAHITALRHRLKGATREHLRELLAPAFNSGGPGWESLCSWQRDLWRTRMGELRLFCVCECNDNLLLWAHYSQNHTGAVFQFECLPELDVPLLVAEAVQYSDEAPAMATEEQWLDAAVGLSPFPTGAEVWRRLVTTKARVWEHEKEWRVVTTRRSYEHQGFEDVSFYPQEISKVFLGCRAKEEDRAGLLSLLGGPFAHAEVYQARQHPSMYRLEFDRIR